MARRYADQGLAVMQGFQMGAQAVRNWNEDKKKAELTTAMNDIGNAKVESDTGFTQEQGGVLEAAAKAGKEVTFDQAAGGYVIANPGGEALAVNPGARNTFLGKSYNAAPTEAEQDQGRLSAMASVMAKNGNPMEAMRLKQRAIQNEHLAKSSVLQDLNINAAQRADTVGRAEEQFKAGLPDLMKNSRYATSQQEGRQYGLADSLADSATFLGYKAQNGKFDPTEWQGLAAKLKVVEDEGYIKALRKAESGGAMAEVVSAFNASGQQKIDPKQVTGDTMGTVNIRGEAVPSRIITYKDAQGNDRTINVTAELAGLGETKDLLATHFAGKKDKRDERGTANDEKRTGIEGGRLGVAQAAESRAAGKDTRDEARFKAVTTGLAEYDAAEARGDEQGMSAARRAVLANGGKLDKPTAPKADVKVGNMGDITVSQPDGKGGVKVTNYGPDMKQKGAVSVGSGSGGGAAEPKTKEDFAKLAPGTVYIDPEDGKRYQKPKPDYGNRADGTPKGSGYLGELKRPDGKGVSTEISVGVDIDGKNVEIPTLIPGLTKAEINTLLTVDLSKGADEIPKPIIDKAVAYAKKRIAAGKSPFAN